MTRTSWWSGREVTRAGPLAPVFESRRHARWASRAHRSPQRLRGRPRALAAGLQGLWVGSRVMATMATMATPKLNLEKKKQGRGGRGDNPPTDTQHEIFF